MGGRQHPEPGVWLSERPRNQFRVLAAWVALTAALLVMLAGGALPADWPIERTLAAAVVFVALGFLFAHHATRSDNS